MKRKTKTNSHYARQALLALLASSVLTAAPVSGTTQAKTSQSSLSDVTAVVQSSFGSAVEAVTAFKPYQLTGDFNSDGIQDLLIIVRIKRLSELPKDVNVSNPFGYGKSTFPAIPSTTPTLAIAILHGSKRGAFTGKYLLVGESPILILQNSRATSDREEDRSSLMELIRKRTRLTRGALRPPAAARGDAILLGTEAAESTLYWNGKTYRWQESEGGE